MTWDVRAPLARATQFILSALIISVKPKDALLVSFRGVGTANTVRTMPKFQGNVAIMAEDAVKWAWMQGKKKAGLGVSDLRFVEKCVGFV
ncbi:hypothetical protein MCOR02_009459 [Pyricularia oryzae]|uniref:Uncharacterized protein n=1 Tax=Pyricularia grisea TaxID=148305 RepID=A0ABQ8NJS1_PYRGI|nr:hypothetical protein MCOR01_001710 [Pyricularia oryzae]KAI6298196.1 hypothetical protein MCOR33_005655 [Pyricularia grisea]KAH9429722.1 hypothetical protein MCOR02_009459 [Pyricularia oryzae]KAI6503768.1 hypothetical protein MCOR13_005026 [Pyricularia oryzae]KAI6560939.1 hypothetical protein MCOR03_004128 [Pyricularia oryzae]